MPDGGRPSAEPSQVGARSWDRHFQRRDEKTSSKRHEKTPKSITRYTTCIPFLSIVNSRSGSRSTCGPAEPALETPERPPGSRLRPGSSPSTELLMGGAASCLSLRCSHCCPVIQCCITGLRRFSRVFLGTALAREDFSAARNPSCANTDLYHASQLRTSAA